MTWIHDRNCTVRKLHLMYLLILLHLISWIYQKLGWTYKNKLQVWGPVWRGYIYSIDPENSFTILNQWCEQYSELTLKFHSCSILRIFYLTIYKWNELTILRNDLTFLWNNLTNILWNDLTWNDLTMGWSDGISLGTTELEISEVFNVNSFRVWKEVTFYTFQEYLYKTFCFTSTLPYILWVPHQT